MLIIKHLSKSVGDTLILNNINISIEKNTIVGLAGPSGSGKSTLLRCIQQLEKPTVGACEYMGKAGFMFQDFQLFPHMTVLDNLIYAPTLINKSIDHTREAHLFLKQLGIANKANVYPHTLSGGQKQRVALARSLMLHPQLLLCDEPTSGLDLATTLDVVTLLQSVRDRDITMIIASHDLDFLTKIADRLLVLKAGSLIADINPRLVESPLTYLKNIDGSQYDA